MKTFIRITFFEIKKMFCKKYIYAAIIALTIALTWYLYTCYNYDYSSWMGERELYKNILGQLTEDKYYFLIGEKKEASNDSIGIDGENITDNLDKGKYMSNRFVDKIIIEGALEKCDYVFANEDNRKIIIQRAENNIIDYKSRNDDSLNYKIKFNQKVIDAYKKQPQVYLIDPLSELAWNEYFGQGINAVIIILLLLIIISPVFVNEKEIGLKQLLDTYPKGKGNLFFAKVLAGSIISIFVTIYFELVYIINILFYVKEMNGIEYPIQSLLPLCPFNLTIGEAVVIKIVCMCIVSILMGLFFMLFSMSFSKNVKCLGAGLIFSICAYGIVFYEKIWTGTIMNDFLLQHVREIFEKIRPFLVTYLYTPLDYMKTFECINILNEPVFTIHVAVFLTIALAILLNIIMYFMYNRKHLKSI